MNIVLTGPMGAGKTAVGMLVAERLGREFVDTDRMIESQEGRTISEIFAECGEAGFRNMEARVIEEVPGKDNLVIAAGGGAVLSNRNMKYLRSNGIIVSLKASPDTLLKRLDGADCRPLLPEGEGRADGLERYLAARAPYYANTDFTIDTNDLEAHEVAERICAISGMPFARICGCISGNRAKEDIQAAVMAGVSMLELRLDLIPDPDVPGLVDASAVPVIATDRKCKKHLKEAIMAGCDLVDIEADSPQKDEIIRLAREAGCKTIASFHDFCGMPETLPDTLPDKGNADLLKVAVAVNSREDMKKLVTLQAQREDIIIVGMGALGTPLRVFGPLLGSYLTYCSIGEPVAKGQLSLESMIALYRGVGLR